MILYFSGTGNSRYIAWKIAQATKDALISLNDRIKANNIAGIHSEKPIIVVCPVYAGRIPRVVEKHIYQTAFDRNQKVYFVLTCTETAYNAQFFVKRLCKKKQFTLMGFEVIPMPQNYIVMHPANSQDEDDKIVKHASQPIQRISTIVQTGGKLSELPHSWSFMSNIANPLFYRFMVKANAFYAADNCIGCGACIIRCPLNNIQIVNCKPQWGKRCTHCMACIGGCSQNAVEYGKDTVGKTKYYFHTSDDTFSLGDKIKGECT